MSLNGLKYVLHVPGRTLWLLETEAHIIYFLWLQFFNPDRNTHTYISEGSLRPRSVCVCVCVCVRSQRRLWNLAGLGDAGNKLSMALKSQRMSWELSLNTSADPPLDTHTHTQTHTHTHTTHTHRDSAPITQNIFSWVW